MLHLIGWEVVVYTVQAGFGSQFCLLDKVWSWGEQIECEEWSVKFISKKFFDQLELHTVGLGEVKTTVYVFN